MKNSIYLFFLSFMLSGCVMINIPGPAPLAEKTIGGKGADKILVMDISGIIIDEETNNIFGVETKPNITARVKEELTLASEDEHVKAIILRINTPGGAVTTCDIINHEIRNFKKKRNIPVIAELMDVAASGGYYIAVTADSIIAHPTTVTGSIGVITYNVNVTGLMEKIGVQNQTIKSGDKKDIGSPLKQMTEEERRILQSVIDGLYNRFLYVIMEGRKGISESDLRNIADGRVYTAEQALNLKLIDGIGYMDDAINLAQERTGIEEARIITYANPKAYKNNIYSTADGKTPSAINIINFDPGPLARKPGLSFMYLMP